MYIRNICLPGGQAPLFVSIPPLASHRPMCIAPTHKTNDSVEYRSNRLFAVVLGMFMVSLLLKLCSLAVLPARSSPHVSS